MATRIMAQQVVEECQRLFVNRRAYTMESLRRTRKSSMARLMRGKEGAKHIGVSQCELRNLVQQVGDCVACVPPGDAHGKPTSGVCRP